MKKACVSKVGKVLLKEGGGGGNSSRTGGFGILGGRYRLRECLLNPVKWEEMEIGSCNREDPFPWRGVGGSTGCITVSQLYVYVKYLSRGDDGLSK